MRNTAVKYRLRSQPEIVLLQNSSRNTSQDTGKSQDKELYFHWHWSRHDSDLKICICKHQFHIHTSVNICGRAFQIHTQIIQLLEWLLSLWWFNCRKGSWNSSTFPSKSLYTLCLEYCVHSCAVLSNLRLQKSGLFNSGTVSEIYPSCLHLFPVASSTTSSVITKIPQKRSLNRSAAALLSPSWRCS